LLPDRVSNNRTGDDNAENPAVGKTTEPEILTGILAPAPLTKPSTDNVWLPDGMSLGTKTCVRMTPDPSARTVFKVRGVDCIETTTHSLGENPPSSIAVSSPASKTGLSIRSSRLGKEANVVREGGAKGITLTVAD
jgi:hypothetical protein